MALSDAQLLDVRRHLGYPLTGTTMPITDDQDTVYLVFGWVTMSLHRRLSSLTATEEAVVVKYLTTLAGLEAAIPTAGDNLDTNQAAVWYRNRSEVQDRASLFDGWRRRMCSFIGCRPGPGLMAGGQLVRG